MTRQFLGMILTIATIISLAIVGTGQLAHSQQVLNPDEKVEAEISLIKSISIPFQGRSRLANRYTFEAKKGDLIEIDAIRSVNTIGNLALILVDPNGYQTIVDDNLDRGARESIQKQADTGGNWLLIVVSKTEQPARYSLLLSLTSRNELSTSNEQNQTN